tara:strand:+ start:13114 stop:13533 length:420 start_codon:yes stop_codon:yes gene_type:complete
MGVHREELHIAGLEQLNVDEPVVMLNLMKFRDRSSDGDGSGWDAYQRYSKEVIGMLKTHGGTILWAGPVESMALGELSDGDWDYVSMVLYPRPAAFLNMMNSDAYRGPNEHRENGTEKHSIIALSTDYSKFLGVHNRAI